MILSFGAHRVAPIYLQQVALFNRTLTTTDSQTSLLVESDRLALDVLDGACLRV